MEITEKVDSLWEDYLEVSVDFVSKNIFIPINKIEKTICEVLSYSPSADVGTKLFKKIHKIYEKRKSENKVNLYEEFINGF